MKAPTPRNKRLDFDNQEPNWILARQITRKSFLRHVSFTDLRKLERALGYATHYRQGVTMANENSTVAYYLSTVWEGQDKGKPCAVLSLNDHTVLSSVYYVFV